MGQVIASASMSLDGYIAKDDNTIGRLFDWLQNGSVEFRTVNDDITLHLSPPSAEGGALRSQDLRTSGDPVSLDGTVIRP